MTPTLSGFRSHGIREPLTKRIAGILDEYPDGTQIARELLQNSDDARSKFQWYLLDHRHHFRHQVDGPKLFHENLREYMGPALLAGSDSLFEENDFKSMKNLADSEKKSDETKIGQMGIGFNSIYHMTDCPSFISGDQFMVIEPHERIFNGVNSTFTEGAVRGNFVDNTVGLELFPDQLKTFAVLEDIDFTKPYPGTIFRFPLRTNEQAQESRLSKNAYPAEKVLEMLAKLKNEALRGILFLKHIERIEIYEIKEGQRQPSKIFQIEIVNAKEVRKERKHLLANLKPHVYPDPSSSRDAILEYSVRPIFKLTQEDGTVTEETWHITTMVGNVLTAHEYMAEETGGVLSNHKLIPWVGIGAPAEPGTKIDSSRLFCFLPIGIQLPFPVHVNGHFAVKQSRREIWTNQDKDFSSDSSANIKSVWNIHLFQSHIPVVYAKFLNTLGLARGPSYDLWPVSCGQGLGLDAIWKNLLTDTLQVVCDDNLPVFFCKDGGPSEYRVVDYQSSWIAGRDIDGYHLLLDALQNLVNVVAGLPDPILNAIPGVVEPLDLDNRILTPTLVRDLLREHKRRWSSVVSNETKVEMLKYCIEDNDIADLEGLPLLPLAGNQWVEFDVDKSNSRYLVSQEIFKVLSLADDGLVDINIDPVLVEKFRSDDAFKIFWSKMKCSTLASRVKNMYQRLYYETSGNVVRSLDPIAQPSVFPTKNWTIHFWEMVFSLSQAKRKRLLSLLEGIHVLPVTQERLAPLSRDLPVVYLDRMKHEKDQTLVDFLNVLECQLGYRVLRSDAFITDAIAEGYVFEVSDAVMVIQVLSKVDQSKLYDLGQNLREIICGFMAKWLPVDQVLNDVNLRTLRSLPIYRLYEASTLVSLEAPETGMSAPKWRVAWRFTSADYPWLPTAFKLLADGQPMGQHLTKTIKIQAIKESEYWFSVISNLLHYPEDDWDSIMEKMCIMYHIHKQEHDFASVMRDLPFVRTTGPEQSGEESGPRRPPLSIVHPDLSLYYMAHEDVFPVGVYSQAPVFGVLDEMGMRSKFDAPLILDRVRILSSQDGNIGDGNNNCNLEARTDALRALYAQMNIDFTNGFATHEMQSTLRSRSWILATSLSDTNQRLCTVQESRPRSDAVLIGDQMPMSIFDFNNRFLIRCLGWDHSPPLDHVLAHFLTMIDRFRVEAMSDEDVPSFNKIYNYLLEKMEVHSNLVVMKETLADLPWIAISGSLHPVDRVALKLRCDLAPHFVQVTTSDIKLNKLFLAMGVRETVGQADLQGLISTVANRYGEGDSITEADSDFVVKILLAMTGPDVKFRWSADLLIPTTANLLCKIEDVVYDDVGAQMRLKSGDGSKPPPYKFTSSKIAKSTAQKLLISMVSTRSWNDQKDSTFVPWAQEENILDRIGSILNDYHPSSIFTEFLQNAEDAGATKCCFMLDQTRYDKGKTLSAEMDVWQGPALVIYNDAEFTENDFVALSHISVGSKRDDPTKIGRHGLGFNSVYHFTDVPSIVSGSYLGFFDPHHQYLPKKQTPHGLVAEGGQRCQFAKLDNDMFSNQLAPYRGLFECDMETHFKGTIFRIPLRTADTSQDNGQDKAIARVWTVEEVDSMLRNWARDARVGMVFLENVKTIEIQDNAREKASFRWSATKTAGCSKQMHRVLNEQQSESGAETCVIDISATRMDTMKWLVHTEPNFPVDTASDIKDLAQKNRWHSHRGVAIPLNFNYKQGPFLGRMFTHLPTPIHTGLPFHIHGVFALMSNRKGLAGGTDEVDPMWKWNHFMMEKILPLTSANAFEKLLKWMFRAEVQTNGGLKHKEIEHIIAEYFKFWPFKSKNEGAQGQNHVGVFTKQFIRLSYDHPIFPCRSASSVPIEGKKGQEVTFTGTSLSSVPGSLDRAIRGRLQQMKINVCDCSERVEVQIEADWKSSKGSSALTYRYINPDLIRRLIRQDPGFIPKSAKTIEEKRWILDFALGVVLDPKAYAAITEPLSGLALIPLVNGEWKELQNESLLPTVYYVAKPAMKELIRGEDVLVDESLFKSVKDQKSSGETTVITSLERILTRLINDTPYCIKEMPPEKFADVICAENPDGIAISIRDKVWRMLDKYEDLRPFGEIPILKTLDGHFRPLKDAFLGLEVSSIQDLNTRQNMHGLASLLRDLGVVVFDAAQNNKHSYLTKQVSKADRASVLLVIANCQDWPDDRVITKGEAEVLRSMISKCTVDEIKKLAKKFGHLRIWQSWAPTPFGQDPPLISAQGSYFLDSDRAFDWSSMGDNADLIRFGDNSSLLAMGAMPLSVVSAVETRLLPRIHNGTMRCTGTTRALYIELFKEVIRLAIPVKRKKANPAAKELLLNKRFILVQDGTLQSSKALFNPYDPLCSVIFAELQSKFPDPSMWGHIWSGKNHLFSFRQSSDPAVIRECASRVLDMTLGVAELPPGVDQLPPNVVRAKAAYLIDFIYKNDEQNIWLDQKWRIVPAEITTRSPYSELVPTLPAYLSFGELMDSAWHDLVWTQSAFFPENLKPPPKFKNRFPNVGTPDALTTIEHLKVLVTELAPVWKSAEKQLALNLALSRIYKALDDLAADSARKVITKLLDNRFPRPYILKGNDTSDPGSWVWPTELMLDIENDIDHFYSVPPRLQAYRRFLVAAGAQEMQVIEGKVDVREGRKAGALEARLLKCFEEQNRHSGFMDLRFQFATGQELMAHKFVLVYMSDYFNRFFTGPWAEHTSRDPLNPGVEVIDLSSYTGTYEAFYGLVHYCYTDRLIPTNGPPMPPSQGSSATDELGDRVQYLVELLNLTNLYQTHRLKELIASEIVTKRKVTHGNVFNLREHAELFESKDILGHCNEYLRKNGSSVEKYLKGELAVYRKSLDELTGDENAAKRSDVKEEIEELERSLQVLAELLNS